ncbi:molybdenum cofactor biosynthesis protein MoeB [Aliarcobacter trophiarum LMG 25534]|uniref:Molybdopterin-synthase adenylyltransferase n=1 Tax=Aliarcobacter trophiarum LMG 25534 TaxID=1032241 RepID=A0AAD0VMY5_9BACT|nr:molybdopterin-synthase adenylyltransferase MoeB [Aliarcobacter trophiarum]AXK49772.1 ThiS adenylyltransferase (Rhodanese domain) [Aliarcobacter trophiarum LMG 25534]RXI28094.1 molybdenum cofactor biosynthesis protein MoeB [Aliarcobacter trophiarum]RXJ92452.1 molybdenum cofactor biosynthesis protein MoeB [Aliarcobacter trophiarum LMG 25534]
MSERSKQTRLSQEEIERYSRHLILPEVGLEGQLRLKNSKVLVVGTGALGSPVLLYLSAAGIGTIGIIDFDTLDLSNLQRQVIHSTNEIGNLKINSAKTRINAINPNIEVLAYSEKLTSQNALEIIKNFDVIVDGTDNFPTRYLINDACVLLNKPFVYGAIFRFEGQTTVFNADEDTPCYRCIFRDPPKAGLVPSCSEAGVLGVLPGIIGTIQANETIKLLLGVGEVLKGRLLTLNALKTEFKEYKIKKDVNCKVCGENATIKELIDYEEFCGLKNLDESFVIKDITIDELKRLLDEKEDIQIIDIRQNIEPDLEMINDSKNIKADEIVPKIDELQASKKCIVVCTIGLKSKEVILKLKKAGYKGELYSLRGGITSWVNDLKD